MNILNATQHQATKEQLVQGVINMTPEHQSHLVELLTFEDIPSEELLFKRATAVAQLVELYPQCVYVMIGGAPFFMPYLESAIALDTGKAPIYAFSKRVSTEVTNEDGVVIKTNTFQHIGFVGL